MRIVLATSGSRGDVQPMIALLIHAASQLNKRIIISKFWKGNTGIEPSKDIFFIKNYPHEYLFPKMAAIIHHGGAGTTAAAALSGKPQILVVLSVYAPMITYSIIPDYITKNTTIMVDFVSNKP